MNGKKSGGLTQRALPAAVFLTFLFGAFACGGSDSTSQNPNQDDARAPGPAAVYAQGWLTIVTNANSATTKLDSLGHFETSRNACGHEAYGNVDVDLWNLISDQTNKAFTSPSVASDGNCFARPDGNKMDGTVELEIDATYSPTPGGVTGPAPAALTTALYDDRRHSPTPTPTDDDPTSEDPTPIDTATPIPTPTPIPTTPIPTTTPTSHPTSTPTATPTHTATGSPAPTPSASPTPKRALFETKGDQICTTIKDQQLAQQLIQNIGKLVDTADKQDCANGWGH